MSRDDANMAFEKFGQWAFDAFWSDGDPGFLDGPDLQDKAVELGLLRKRKPSDGECACGDPGDDCVCLWPTFVTGGKR